MILKDTWERPKSHVPPDSELNQEIAKEIVARRKMAYMSRDNLAEKLKVSRACVAKMESGKDGFKVQTIQRICDVLDCTLAEFFSFASKEKTLDADEEKKISISSPATITITIVSR